MGKGNAGKATIVNVTDKMIFKHVVVDSLNVLLVKQCVCHSSWAEDWKSPVIEAEGKRHLCCPACLREFYFTESSEAGIQVFEI